MRNIRRMRAANILWNLHFTIKSCHLAKNDVQMVSHLYRKQGQSANIVEIFDHFLDTLCFWSTATVKIVQN
jgi:hypothetical protein